jgi:hypothetical protein
MANRWGNEAILKVASTALFLNQDSIRHEALSMNR